MQKLSTLDLLATPAWACTAEPRLSYCLYVPRRVEAVPERFRLLVAVHGTDRRSEEMRDFFAAFAEREDCIVLAPLFPGNLGVPGDLDGYKYLDHGGIRYDRALQDMVAEVAGRYGLACSRFLLFGFSGGAHFAHRYAYLHPETLIAASVAAPGMITLPDPREPYWSGLAGLEAVAGRPLALERLQALPIQVAIGMKDDSGHRSPVPPGTGITDAHVARVGVTRLDRARFLSDALRRFGVAVTHTEVPDAGHQFLPLGTAALPFLGAALARHRGGADRRATATLAG